MMPLSRFRTALCIWFILFTSSFSRAQTPLLIPEALQQPLPLQSHFLAIADPADTLSAPAIALGNVALVPINQFQLPKPDATFWLKATFRLTHRIDDQAYAVNFNHLTYVDLYLFENGQLRSHRRAGAFRPEASIHPGDDRFHFNLTLFAQHTYTLLLKVKHTKQYPPNYSFFLQRTYPYLAHLRHLDLANAWLLGAICILLCYAGLSYFTTRYRPFLWVLLFLFGLGLYSFSIQPIFIDVFFPRHPETGWLLIPIFLHMGIVSFYLLMIDFLEMKVRYPRLYTYGMLIIKGIILFSVLSVLHNAFTSNYYLTNQFNLLFSVVHFAYIGYTLATSWNKLDTSQRYLAYGLITFIIGVFIFVGSILLFDEQSLEYAPLISNTTILLITLLFLMGLNHKLRQHEQEKISVLEQLNTLQKQHNTLIERKVEERTAELAQKNSRIETLIDELNHRVKNNLQMLYSLSTLQIPQVRHEKSKEVLQEMRGRIKAMMLVNEQLHASQEHRSLAIHQLVAEISQHLQQIFDPHMQIHLETIVPLTLTLHANASLSFGLILTELYTNSFKHAFNPHTIDPTIQVHIHQQGDTIQLHYQDNGSGGSLSGDRPGMGISLIHDLTRQLRGAVTIQQHPRFSYQFSFPYIP